MYENKINAGNDDPKCDDRHDGWIRFELRYLICWVLSTSCFLVYANLFKF